MSNRPKALAIRIRQLGLKQNRLAALSGLDEATISNVLTGQRNPLNSTLEALEKAVASEEDRLRKLLNPTEAA